MLPRWGFAMFALALLLGEGGQSAVPADYVPAAPPAALNAAVRSNLKLVQHWLSEKDFVSAAEATQGLATVAQLYSYQSTDPDWRKRVGVLQQAIAQLAEAVRRRSLPDCKKAAGMCDRLLDDLAKSPPVEKKPDPAFRPFGTSKVWMTLLEGAYVDAKRAETARELELVSQAIAEEVGVVGRMRANAKWQASAGEVRDAALRVAQLAGNNQLPEARKALKEIYRRCETCHQREKR